MPDGRVRYRRLAGACAEPATARLLADASTGCAHTRRSVASTTSEETATRWMPNVGTEQRPGGSVCAHRSALRCGGVLADEVVGEQIHEWPVVPRAVGLAGVLSATSSGPRPRRMRHVNLALPQGPLGAANGSRVLTMSLAHAPRERGEQHEQDCLVRGGVNAQLEAATGVQSARASRHASVSSTWRLAVPPVTLSVTA
jgi:hypothetical protein